VAAAALGYGSGGPEEWPAVGTTMAAGNFGSLTASISIGAWT